MPSSISEYMPQCNALGARGGRRAFAVWCAASLCVMALVGLVVAAPWLAAEGYARAAWAIYGGFAPLCHQMAERSFQLWGAPLAVCARCAGLYGGFAAGVLFYPLLRPLGTRTTPWRGWLIASAVPTSVDFALGYFGLWENTHLSRSLTGALCGAVAALYVLPGLVDLSHTGVASRLRARQVGG